MIKNVLVLFLGKDSGKEGWEQRIVLLNQQSCKKKKAYLMTIS